MSRQRQRTASAAPEWVKPGARVWYSPIMLPGQPRYAGVVECEPWQLGHGAWVVNLRDMEPAYQAAVRQRTRVNAACMEALAPRLSPEAVAYLTDPPTQLPCTLRAREIPGGVTQVHDDQVPPGGSA